MKSKKSLIIILSCVAAVLIALTAVIIVKKNSKSSFGKGKGPRGAQQGPISVKTKIAEPQILHDYVNTNGEIEPQSTIDVFPDIGGNIVKVNVLLGSTVERGAVIAEIDPSVPGAQYAHSPVYAPVSGTITRTPLKQGAKVAVSSVITTIGDVENLQITANVPERYVSDLRLGLKADIILESYPDQIFSATVIRVSPVVDSASRTKQIILNFDSKDNRINAGMFAKVKLWTQDYKDKIVVPENAVIDKNGIKGLYVVEQELDQDQNEIFIAHFRPVEIGKSVDSEIQILSGVNSGEKIVIEGMRILSDGAKVLDITK